MTVPSSSLSDTSPAEVSKQIKALIKELPEIRADAARLDDLRRIFTRLEAEGELSFGTPPPKSPVAAKWHAFLHKSHKTMVSQLCDRVQLGRHSAIRCLWGVIAGSPLTKQQQGNSSSSSPSYKYMNVDLLQKWMRAMIRQESTYMDNGMKNMVEGEFFRPFRDVQYYSLGSITALATAAYNNEGCNDQKTAEKLLELLMMVPVPSSDEDLEGNSQYLFSPPVDAIPDEVDDAESDEDSQAIEEESDEDSSDDESESDGHEQGNVTREESGRPQKRRKLENRKFSFQRMRMFRREYQKAWLAVLRLDLPVGSLKQALHFLPKNVLSYVSHPLRFSDFFMQAYSDHELGVIGVLALDGLFLLMTEYGLEYPNFYKQLYKLVSAKVLYAKYRTRFFSLLNKCLIRNEMLPAYLVAAFIKRLCRCGLNAPPSAALFVLALVSNLLRKHPECNCLVQRKEGTAMEDLFAAEEDDPVECRALQSSLWELAVYERHYYPAVATLAKSIGREEEAKAPPHIIDDFAGHTYASLFSQEKKKKTKTALTFKEPASLFTEDDIFSGCLEIGSS